VRVVSIWYQDAGEWFYCIYSGSVKFAGGPSPYTSKDGQSICPLIIGTAYIDRENNRYGIVRDLIDPQDSVNKRNSKLLHLASTRQLQQTLDAEVSADVARKENADPSGVLPVGFNPVPTTDIAAGQVQHLQFAMGYIQQAGPNAALLGKGTESQSGRAIEAQQNGGLIELGDLMDTLRVMDRASFRFVAAMMQQFWTAERWVRVTDDPMSPRYVGLNVPQTDEFGMVMGVENSVPEMDLDFMVEDAPDLVSLEGPAYEAMMQLLMGAANLPPAILKLAVELNPALPLAKKRKVLDVIEQMGQPQGPDPAQQQMMQLQGQKVEADIEKTRADAMRSFSQAQETMVRAQVPEMQAIGF